MSGKEIIIGADLLYDGRTKASAMSIVVQGNKIVEVSPKKYRPSISGIVTPAFIDPHSHIGMERQGEPVGESEVDDTLMPFSPLHDPINSIYFDDRALTEAVDFGVLYSCVLPGSGNIMGGQAKVIRNFAPNRRSAVVRECGLKMALGYNPRSATAWKGARPTTRMGTATLLENYFQEILRKEEQAKIEKERAVSALAHGENTQRLDLIKRAYDAALSAEQWAVLKLLNGEAWAKVHVHKADDALYLIDLKTRFNLKVTAEHACDIGDVEIFNVLAKNDIPVVYGPVGSFDYKVELKNASYKHAAVLMQSKADFGLMTDHPVILAHHLRDSLKYFLIHGMVREDAVSLITRKNAAILGVDDCLGTIEPGKFASMIVWDKDVFHLGAFPLLVMAEGRIIRDRR
jgi:imidazolonepropionase-like amidohydrolase